MLTRGHTGDEPGSPAGRTYQVRTYGCQMNVHDSERLAGLLEAADALASRSGVSRNRVIELAITEFTRNKTAQDVHALDFASRAAEPGEAKQEDASDPGLFD